MLGTQNGTVKIYQSGHLVLQGGHGHHLYAFFFIKMRDIIVNAIPCLGSILFFKARLMPSLVNEYSLTETSTALTASRIWSYDPGGDLWTAALGDVQRYIADNLNSMTLFYDLAVNFVSPRVSNVPDMPTNISNVHEWALSS